jgi:putative endopeptidase
MMVGRFYVERHFTDDDLAQITDIVNAIREEYRVAIKGSTLFSEETKKQALRKLDKLVD